MQPFRVADSSETAQGKFQGIIPVRGSHALLVSRLENLARTVTSYFCFDSIGTNVFDNHSVSQFRRRLGHPSLHDKASRISSKDMTIALHLITRAETSLKNLSATNSREMNHLIRSKRGVYAAILWTYQENLASNIRGYHRTNSHEFQRLHKACPVYQSFCLAIL